MLITTQRIYDKHAPLIGHRVLVDRLWPRGISKDAANLDDWWKDLTPSTELRQWFHQDQSRWIEFCEKYWLELRDNEALAKDLLSDVKGQLVLLYGSKDTDRNHAMVLKAFLEDIVKNGRVECASSPCFGEG